MAEPSSEAAGGQRNFVSYRDLKVRIEQMTPEQLDAPVLVANIPGDEQSEISTVEEVAEIVVSGAVNGHPSVYIHTVLMVNGTSGQR